MEGGVEREEKESFVSRRKKKRWDITQPTQIGGDGRNEVSDEEGDAVSVLLSTGSASDADFVRGTEKRWRRRGGRRLKMRSRRRGNEIPPLRSRARVERERMKRMRRGGRCRTTGRKVRIGHREVQLFFPKPSNRWRRSGPVRAFHECSFRKRSRVRPRADRRALRNGFVFGDARC